MKSRTGPRPRFRGGHVIPSCKPSPAMLVALLSLFVALGGSSYAALRLPTASVGGKQLKRNAVTSPKVKPGSLLLSDFRAAQLALLRGPEGPQGPRGLPGAPGATGEAGATKVVRRLGPAVVVPADKQVDAVAMCDPGERAVGGGAETAGTADTAMTGSKPVIDIGSIVPKGWQTEFYNRDANNDNVGSYLVGPVVTCAAP